MRFSGKRSNLELWCLLSTYRKLCNWAFQRTHYFIPKIQDGWDPPFWKSTCHFFLPTVVRFGKNFGDWCRMTSTAVMWSKSNDGRLGEFNGMSSHSHVSHCRVLPLDEFTVTIPEPHATLQGAVTWRSQCHDRTTLQGVRIPSAILKIVFRHSLFIFVFNAV